MIAELSIKESLQEQSLKPILMHTPVLQNVQNGHFKSENQNNQLNVPFMIPGNYDG